MPAFLSSNLCCTSFPLLSFKYTNNGSSSSSSLVKNPSTLHGLATFPCTKPFEFKNKTKQERAFPTPSPRAQQGSSTMEDKFSVLAAVRTEHNEIVIVDTPDARILLLDSTHNIHSLYKKEEKWTGSYWDEFASLPPIVPQGPIAILGLGGGTAAHLMLDLWPSLYLEGWEIDRILIDKAREYLGLSDLEIGNQKGGILVVRIGDALSPSAVVTGGFAGIVVDLFSSGKVLQQLHQVTTWLELNERLMPSGRIMVNCGGIHAEKGNFGDETDYTQISSESGAFVQNSTIRAMCEAFPGNLSWKRMQEGDSDNFLALTGPPPDLNAWSAAVPARLSSNVKCWKPCELA